MHPTHLTHMSSPSTQQDLVARLSQAHDGEALLDNPILNALVSDHRSLAVVQGEARRYPVPIGPLAGVPDQSLASYNALRPLAGPGGLLGLFFPDQPAPPVGWSLFRGGVLVQMICREPKGDTNRGLDSRFTLRRLVHADVPLMIELARLTEPGPFRERTIELGNFYGILEGNRLLAMAGQRMRLPGFAEVSAVCTHPDAQGRGFAGILMNEVIGDIVREGRTPFLHALAENPAIRLYERLGFALRRRFHLSVIKNEA